MRILGNLEDRPKVIDLPNSTPRDPQIDPQVSMASPGGAAHDAGEVTLRGHGPGTGAAEASGGKPIRPWHREVNSSVKPAHGAPDPQPRRSTTAALWCAVVALAFALIAELGYSYSVLRKNHLSLVQVPDIVRSVSTLGEKMTSTEGRLHDLATNWSDLRNDVANVDHKVDATIQAARHQTRDLVAQAEGRLKGEMEQRAQAVDTRLNQVESAQRDDRTRLETLNNQLQQQVSGLRNELASNQDGTNRDLSALHEQADHNADSLTILAQQLQRERVSFEVGKNSPTEVLPGLSLTVLKTNPSYQQFRGYVSLTEEGQTLWLENLGAGEAVDLYPHDASHPYSLIVTRVNDSGIVGYVLLPGGMKAS